MLPTYRENDRVLVLRHFPTKWLRKGQVVIVWHTPSDLQIEKWPKDPSITPYIKRLIRLPGDTIVTDFYKLHPALQESHPHKFNGEAEKIHQIPEGFIFVTSDNLSGGYDSHSWGPISSKGVLGIILLKF